MVERVQPQSQQAAGESELDGLPPPPAASSGYVSADALNGLLRELRAAPGNPELAAQLNQLLPRLASGEDEGRLLLQVLSDGSLSGLVDSTGINCRREAVRALLRLGFPWALEIDPETLQWFREVDVPKGRASRWTVLALALLIGAGGALGYYGFAQRPRPPPPPTAPAPAPLPREVAQVQDRFQKCAEASPSPVDTMVTLTIGPDGAAFPRILDRTIPGRGALVTCLIEATRSMRFAAAPASSDLKVPLLSPRR